MDEKKIFIFDAEEGMSISRDVILPDGFLIVPSGTVLTFNIIKRISDFHILEIYINQIADIHSGPDETDTYFEKFKQTPSYKKFNQKYLSSVASMKDKLNQLIEHSSPIDTSMLLNEVNELMDETKNTLNLFDMLHSMRDYDDITYVHSINVALISSILGKWLGCSKRQIELLTLSGLLHDIGKMLVPNDILSKSDKLTLNEFDTVKKHVALGYNKLMPQDIDESVKEACLLHHERCDGSGYPFGLHGNRIPFTAKIVAIADVYDAMTSCRIYRKSICPFEVIKMMEADAFNKFDPNYMIPFLNNIISSYVHNNVRLSNGQIGEVIMVNQTALSRPIIKCDSEFIDLSKHRELEIEYVL